MHFRDKQPLQTRPLRKFEKEVAAALMIYCCSSWQDSSPYMRQRYPRFARDRKTLEKESFIYDETVLQGAFSISQLFHYLLKPLVAIEGIYERQGNPSRFAGELLRWASYAGCLLGHEASFGDLETELRLLYASPAWVQREISPRVLLTMYKHGDSQRLVALLNDKLDQASEQVVSLNREGIDPLFHAPPIWSRGKSRLPVWSAQVVTTGYHLYSSLAQLIEQNRGHD